MFPSSIRDRQIVFNWFNTDNLLINLGTIFFCALSLVMGYLISSSITYTIFVAAALFGIVTCFKPEFGLYLMVFLIPFHSISHISQSFSLTAITLVGWLVLAGWMLNVALTKQPIIFPREWRYLVAFIAWGLVSFFWTVDPIKVVQKIPTAIQLLGFYLLVINLVNSKDKLYRLFWILIAGCLIGSGMTIYHFLERSLHGLNMRRIALGEGGDVNNFPDTLLLVIPFLFLSIIFGKSKLWRLGLLATTIAILMALFIGISRQAVLGLAVIIVLMFIKYRKQAPNLIVFVPICILAGLYFMPEKFWNRMTEYGTDKTYHESIDYNPRLDIWSVGWTMIKENPLLGVGLNSFKADFGSYLEVRPDITFHKTAAAPHNIYVQVLAELGIIGAVLFFMAIVAHLRSGYNAVRSFEGKEDQSGGMIAVSVLLSFPGLLVAGMFGNILYTKFFWLSMTLIGAVGWVASSPHLAVKKV
jgi:O-antigen ligase